MVRGQSIRFNVLAVLLLAGLVAGCIPPPEPQLNLLKNPGAERGSGESPSWWARSWFRPTSALIWDDQIVRRGARSLKIESPVPNDARWVQTVEVQPHTLYELSGWIRTEDVAPSAEAVDAGASLGVLGIWDRTDGVRGTSDWTFQRMRFRTGDETSVRVAARLGFWAGTTTGTAWFDDIRLAPARTTRDPRWDILVLIYDHTDWTFRDPSGNDRHVVARMTPGEVATASSRATAFVRDDIPALASGAVSTRATVRVVDRPLDQLSPNGGGWWPSPWDTAPERDPAFDAVIVIWDPRGADQLTGEPYWIGSAAGLTPSMGTGQTYATLIAEAAVDYPHRNVFKHEFGHSILSYFEALGASPLPTVDNHAEAWDYVNCRGGAPYVWVDELQHAPIPNSIYNNHSGFTHDYYSGTVATADQPDRCLGITPEAWSHGGPVTYPRA